MSDLTVTRAESGHARTALMLGVASLVLYVGGGFTARHRGEGREATIAVILGAIPVLWTVAFLIVAALS
jgi:hypothetical protein